MAEINELDAALTRASRELLDQYDRIYSDDVPTMVGDMLHDMVYEYREGVIEYIYDMEIDVENIGDGDVEDDLREYWVRRIAFVTMKAQSIKEVLDASINLKKTWNL